MSTVFQAVERRGELAHPMVLDESQGQVLGLPDGVCAAVIGAPGTGKTTTLVEFVVERVLRPGWGPSAVLALAPNRATATRLRDVLAARVAVPTPGPLARTVASLAFDIVGHAARSAGSEPPTLLTGGDQDQIVRALLDGHVEDAIGPAWPDELGPAVRRLRGFRTELRELLMRATEHGVDAAALRELGRRHDRPEWVAAGEFADEYHGVVDALRGNHLDSAELVDYAVAALDRGQSSPLVEGLRLVVVDDAQEATASTVALLRALTRRGVAVVAFGDPDLSTNAFRGGVPDILGRLGQRLDVDDAVTLTLSTAHRHSTALRSFVSSVTDRIGTAGAGRQHAAVARMAAGGASDAAGAASDAAGAADNAAEIPPIELIQAESPAHEIAAVARALREHHLLGGMPWSRMLVVVRSGALVPSVARALQLAEVPTRTPVAGRAVRDEYGAHHLLLAASVATGRTDLTADVATELLSGPLAGFDALSLRRLRLALRAEELAGGGHRSADDLLVEALTGGAGRFATIESRFASRAARFALSLDRARGDAAADRSIEEILWGLWERSGLAAEWSAQSAGRGVVAAEADRHLDGVVALFTSAKRFVERTPEASARAFLDGLLDAEVPEDTLSPQAIADTVLVCAPSGAIGLEVDVVVAARLQDGIWPNLRVRGGLLGPDALVEAAEGLAETGAPVDRRAQVLSDELRMFALTVSRSTRQIILSSAATDDESPSMFLRLVPSDLEPRDAWHPLSLRGLVGHLRHAVIAPDRSQRTAEARTDAAGALSTLSGEGVIGASTTDWYGLLEPSTSGPLVDLDDPEARIPVSPSAIESFEKCPLHWFVERFGGSAPSSAMGLGTVIHDVMEHAVDIDVESLWRAVTERWGELEFESAWLSEAERRRARAMTESLAGYLRDFRASGGSLVGAESEFSLEIGPARLRGKIDRVESTADGHVVIVDLKTGKQIPSAADGETNAQLGSYQLALARSAIAAVDAEPGDSLDGEATHITGPSGGAKLLFVSKGVRGKAYTERWQSPFDADGLHGFEQRVESDAKGMADSVFLARLDEHCEGMFGGACRIHIVGEVSR